MRKIGKPEKYELVVCKITKIHPNSVYAELIEYDTQGIIHVSEVAKKWVRDIREFLKVNQFVVCKVLGTHNNTIELSVKRVNKNDANRKLNAFKRERRAEKMLEQAAKDFKLNLDQIYEEIGYRLIEEFGSLLKAFETAVKNPDLMKRKGIPKKWIKVIKDVAEKAFAEKTYEIKARLNLTSYQGNGISIIKKLLSDAEEKGVNVRYISAPKYEISAEGKDSKKIESLIKKTGENIVEELEKNNGEASFELIE